MMKYLEYNCRYARLIRSGFTANCKCLRSMALLPPAPNPRVLCGSKGYTHTHADRRKVCGVADEEEPSEEGQPTNQTTWAT